MVGERLDEGLVVLAERRDSRGVGPHGPEDAVAGDHRRDEERMDPERRDEAIGALEVLERRVVRIVVRKDDPSLGNGSPEHPDARLDLQLPDPPPAVVVRDPGVVREPEDAGRRVEEVGDRPIGAEESGGLLERMVEDRLVLGRDEAAGLDRDVGRGGGRFRGSVTGAARTGRGHDRRISDAFSGSRSTDGRASYVICLAGGPSSVARLSAPADDVDASRTSGGLVDASRRPGGQPPLDDAPDADEPGARKRAPPTEVPRTP